MSTPLPLPSKAAIRALRGIALGTSCAIGAIVEDRRRRISTLKTAVENKQKLKLSRKYRHSSSEELSWQLDGPASLDHNLQWHERDEYELGKHRDAEAIDYTALDGTAIKDSETRSSYREPGNPNQTQIPQPVPPLASPSQRITCQPFPFPLPRQIDTPGVGQRINNTTASKAIQPHQPTPTTALQWSRDAVIHSVEDFLASENEEGLSRAVALFISSSPMIASSPPLDRWLELSVRLSKECQARGRWEYASQILSTIIAFGPLDEAQYFAYNPLPTIEFHLRRPDPEVPCCPDSVATAARLFLPGLEGKQQGLGAHMESVGRTLMLEALASQLFVLAQRIYWRTAGWAANPERFVRWAIHAYFQHNDHKTVVKIFLLHYSRMEYPKEHFDNTIDRVVDSVQAMKGLNADSILDAFARMECPGNGKLRTRWVMRLLQAHWARHEDLPKTNEIFNKVVSLGILDKVTHPQGIYRTLVQMAARAGDEKMAHSYADKVMRDYPDMKDDITLGLAVFKAKAGNWDCVLQTFKRVQPSELAEPTSYDDAFIPVLKVFADSHSAAETREFAMAFIQDMGIKFHPYMVTLVAKKYGEAHDMKGFISWLEFCSREGFALHAGFVNSVLKFCSTTGKFSFQELRAMFLGIEALHPNCSDEATHRILSQAAHRGGKAYSGVRPKVINVNRMAYTGRTTNHRDLYEAMNQQLVNHKPTSALMIYKRAVRYGMPFSSHCLQLAVTAALRSKISSSSAALSMIRDAHAEGHEVGYAVSSFIKWQINAFSGSPQDVIIHMRNLVRRFESSQIAIGPDVLTRMAAMCTRISQPDKAIALCRLARDRSSASHPCFSKENVKVLATAYSQLLDVIGMRSLLDSLSESEFSSDKTILSHLKSIRRRVTKTRRNHNRAAFLAAIEGGIQRITEARAKARSDGKLIGQETLRIVGDALADLQKSTPEPGTVTNKTKDMKKPPDAPVQMIAVA
ncbi:hypothetical protein NUW58_g1781 [Xylaria curta]|uniref:Uncharacterized protein n=1 Tax=Xylaria curta TaxID=42375 RepID=A0ACC1PKH6_9PEZI|nr:hypothetical protein NUW58_g1781 [Xylaria curta]